MEQKIFWRMIQMLLSRQWQSKATLDPFDLKCIRKTLRHKKKIHLFSTGERGWQLPFLCELSFHVSKYILEPLHVHKHRRSGVKEVWPISLWTWFPQCHVLMHINLFFPSKNPWQSKRWALHLFVLTSLKRFTKNLSAAATSSYSRREKWKITAWGSLRMFYFVWNFSPRLLSLHPLSESLDGVTALGASQRLDKCRKWLGRKQGGEKNVRLADDGRKLKGEMGMIKSSLILFW